MVGVEIEGSTLYHYRKKRKLSQNNLSDITGILQSSISKYEMNIQNPTKEHLLKLAEALLISPEQLMVNAVRRLEMARQVYIHRQADKILEDEGDLDISTPEQTSKLFEQMVEVDPNEESEITENEARFIESAASPGTPVSDLIKGEVVTGD